MSTVFPPPHGADADAETDIGAARRALLRLARRTARRSLLRSLLVVALIAVPIATAIVVAAGQRAISATPEEQRAWEFGQADYVVTQWDSYVVAPSAGQIQRDYGFSETDALLVADWWATARADGLDQAVREVFAADEVVRSVRWGISMGQDYVQIELVDAASPVLEGRASLREGRWPTAAGEASITTSLAAELDVAVGDVTSFDSVGDTTVVGVHADLSFARGLGIVLGPSTPVPDGLRGQAQWLIRSDRGERAFFEASSAISDRWFADAGPETRQALRGWPTPDVQTTESWFSYDSSTPLQLDRPPVLSGFVAGAMLLEVALIAAAAFATGTRRRLREFGLLATIGAEPGHIRRLVMIEAGVLGAVGAAAGVALGLIGTRLLSGQIPRLADHVVDHVGNRPADVIAPAAVGIVAALLAAWFPARTAAGVPVLSALAGRMPTRPLKARTIPAAAGLLVLGLFIVGSGAVAARDANTGGDSSMPIVLMIFGCLLCLAGASLASGWVVGRIGAAADRLPLGLRLVARDAGRQQFRSAVAVAALVVVLAAPVVVAAVAVTAEADERASYTAYLADDEILIDFYAFESNEVDHEAIDEAVAAISDILPVSQVGEVSQVGRGFDGAWGLPGASTDGAFQVASGQVALGDDATLAALRLPPEVGDALASGLAVGLGPGSAAGGDIVVQTYDDETGVSDALRFAAVDFDLRPTYHGTPVYLLPPDVAAAAGLVSERSTTLLVVDRDLTSADRDALVDFVQSDLGFFDNLGVGWEQPLTPFATMAQAIALPITALIVLVIGGCLVAIAATESDRDIATMVRVGAAPSMRRRFLGLQSGYHALLGAALGAPIGLLLLVSLRRALTNPPAYVVPWVTVAVVMIAIPLLLAFVVAVLVRSANPLRRSH